MSSVKADLESKLGVPAKYIELRQDGKAIPDGSLLSALHSHDLQSVIVDIHLDVSLPSGASSIHLAMSR